MINMVINAGDTVHVFVELVLGGILGIKDRVCDSVLA